MALSMINEHLAALNSETSIYHEFLLFYKLAARIVYGFVEGKDDPSFYRGVIENSLPSDWEVRLTACGNRDQALAVLEQLDWTRFPQDRVCFFVDRDLSELAGESLPKSENLYVTDGYSIENSICTIGTFERLIEEVYNIAGLNDPDLEKLRELYRTNTGLFHRAIKPIMAQIVLWHRAGRRPCFNNINVCGMFVANDGIVRLKVDLEKPSDRVKHLAEALGLPADNEGSISATINELDDLRNEDLYIRGKYVMSFFLFCADAIHSSVPKWCPRFRSPPSPRMKLGPKSAMMALAPRARPPDSLLLFLRRNYGKYVSTVG